MADTWTLEIQAYWQLIVDWYFLLDVSVRKAYTHWLADTYRLGDNFYWETWRLGATCTSLIHVHWVILAIWPILNRLADTFRLADSLKLAVTLLWADTLDWLIYFRLAEIFLDCCYLKTGWYLHTGDSGRLANTGPLADSGWYFQTGKCLQTGWHF